MKTFLLQLSKRTSLVLFAMFMAIGLYAQPANNECSGAEDISALFGQGNGNQQASMLFDNTTATTEASDPTTGFECYGEATPVLENTLWFSFVGDGSTYAIATAPCNATSYVTDGDTQMSIYDGDCNALNPVACNEDGPTSSAGDFRAGFSAFQTTDGVTYYVLVDGFIASAGEFCIEVTEVSLTMECEAGSLLNAVDPISVNGDETFTVEAEGVTIPNDPIEGGYAWFFDNSLGGTGALGGNFFLFNAVNPQTYNSDLNGILSGNGFPILSGTWKITGRVYSNPADVQNSFCDETENCYVITFDEQVPVTTCEAGDLITTGTVNVEPMTGTFTLEAENDTVPNSPQQGGYGWVFDASQGGTGALGGTFILNNVFNPQTYNDDLNGVLSSNDFPPMSGTWIARGAVYSDPANSFATICDLTEDSLILVFDPEPVVTACNAGVLTTTDEVDVPIGNTFDLSVMGDTVPNTPTQGDNGWSLSNALGGTGGLNGDFLITGGPNSTYDNDLDGILSTNNFAPLSGTWVFRGVVYSDAANFTVCATTEDSIIVNFEEIELPCHASSFITTETQFVCPGASFAIGTDGMDTIPQGGGFGWLFDDGLGGTGGVAGGTILTNAINPASYNSDLNGILSSNGLDPLQGPFVVRSVIYTNPGDVAGSLCAVSTDSMLVIFSGEVNITGVVDNGDNTATVLPQGNPADFTYQWDDPEMQTTQTITVDASDTYNVTVTNDLGCTATGSVDVILSSIEDIEGVQSLDIQPNPTSGKFLINLSMDRAMELQIGLVDVTGKMVQQIVRENSTGDLYNVDISHLADGIYFLRFQIDNQIYTERILLSK